MEYNSEKEDLIIPEYGRHVQMLLQHAKTIENPEERQACVERIVKLMQQMQPQNRNVEDYREKLWKHAFRIAEYELEVTAPEGINIERDVKRRPDKVDYPTHEASFRHYGHNVQVMVQQAINMPEGGKRDAYAKVIAAYMKLAYRTWNREHYVSDEVIKSDLTKLSGGNLVIDENTAIENLDPSAGHIHNSNNNNNNNRRRGRSNNGPSGRSNYNRRSSSSSSKRSNRRSNNGRR